MPMPANGLEVLDPDELRGKVAAVSDAMAAKEKSLLVSIRLELNYIDI
jgi:hypothetical protein